MWRSKSAILSTLYQTLTDRQVTMIKERYKKYQEMTENSTSTNLMDFEGSIKNLTKMYNEAKDNVKFLTTLERQFKALGTNTLVGVEETLPSLMNGLKTVWIISKHYKQDN